MFLIIFQGILGFNEQHGMSEPPFRPREKLLEKQKYFQSVHRHTYLKGPYDKITSVAIPVALAATSLYLIGRGLYNLSHLMALVRRNEEAS
ncbi:hypothetical protein K2173_011937 [Erythroxylum novogranatense]|uniref:Uncharacterized protein n=1 Tax=Erythroxylum novogranatense TaxID=1862640 RepID=A0AAV8TEP5_9ROSI|nr:hypothetical protein K2173_011937 [Erythroxylum novogranatense]